MFLCKVDLLGHIKIKKGVTVADVKVFVINDLPVPKTMNNSQGLFNLHNFYQQIFRSFSKIAELLTNLINKIHVFFFSSHAPACSWYDGFVWTEAF